MKITKRNGKLTKVEILRRMQRTAIRTGLVDYTISGIARRLSLSIEKTKIFLVWMRKNQNIFWVSNTNRSISFVF